MKDLLYAVVDIETTGSFASKNGITEIAVFVTDGDEIVDEFYAMLNPEVSIPPFIQALTGISDDDVADMPKFEDISTDLYELLKDKVFVAHNVNFDYSFIKYHLEQCGFKLNCRKLDTIRVGRSVLPGLKGYGLDRLTAYLDIQIKDRHSAAGDAAATVKLLHFFIERGGVETVKQMITNQKGAMSFPPNVPLEDIENLPQTPGVYYFYGADRKIIYVGKARNIRRRVRSHFQNNKVTKQKQEFIKRIEIVTRTIS